MTATARVKPGRLAARGSPHERLCCAGLKAPLKEHSLTHAIEQGDRQALTMALKSGKVLVKKRA